MSLGYTTLFLLIALLLASIAWPWWREYRRIRRIQTKYQATPDILADILDQVIWEGESEDQLLDSIGKPHDVQRLARKTKHKEIWKYGHEGGNRYRLRITLDDHVVASWTLR